jgi:hypothetical protein
MSELTYHWGRRCRYCGRQIPEGVDGDKHEFECWLKIKKGKVVKRV